MQRIDLYFAIQVVQKNPNKNKSLQDKQILLNLHTVKFQLKTAQDVYSVRTKSNLVQNQELSLLRVYSA